MSASASRNSPIVPATTSSTVPDNTVQSNKAPISELLDEFELKLKDAIEELSRSQEKCNEVMRDYLELRRNIL